MKKSSQPGVESGEVRIEEKVFRLSKIQNYVTRNTHTHTHTQYPSSVCRSAGCYLSIPTSIRSSLPLFASMSPPLLNFSLSLSPCLPHTSFSHSVTFPLLAIILPTCLDWRETSFPPPARMRSVSHLAIRCIASPCVASPCVVSPRRASCRLAVPCVASPCVASPCVMSPRRASPRRLSCRLAVPRVASPRRALCRISSVSSGFRFRLWGQIPGGYKDDRHMKRSHDLQQLNGHRAASIAAWKINGGAPLSGSCTWSTALKEPFSWALCHSERRHGFLSER